MDKVLVIFSFLSGTACVSNNRKKISEIQENTTGDVESSSSFATTSTVAPVDALEGRKLALKRLQEKLEQFKGKFL